MHWLSYEPVESLKSLSAGAYLRLDSHNISLVVNFATVGESVAREDDDETRAREAGWSRGFQLQAMVINGAVRSLEGFPFNRYTGGSAGMRRPLS